MVIDSGSKATGVNIEMVINTRLKIGMRRDLSPAGRHSLDSMIHVRGLPDKPRRKEFLASPDGCQVCGPALRPHFIHCAARWERFLMISL